MFPPPFFNEFNPAGFCLDLIQENINDLMSDEVSLDVADTPYNSEVLYAADKD